MSVLLLPPFLAVFFNGFHHVFFTHSLPLGCSSPSLSFLFLPLASPSFFPNVTHALAVAPALCAPAHVARAMASDFHANVIVAAGVVSGTLTACGSTPLAVWGALPKRRGNAGSDSELSSHSNTFLEVRWDCVFASSLTRSLTLALALALALALTAQFIQLSLRAHARAILALSPLSRSPFLLPPLLRLRLLFLFVLSSSSLCFLLFFFTSASSSWCFSSWLSSSSPLFPPWLIHVGSSHFGVRRSCWEGWTLAVEQRT